MVELWEFVSKIYCGLRRETLRCHRESKADVEPKLSLGN